MTHMLPVLPLRDTVLFPGIIVPLFVGRPRSLKAVENAILRDKRILVVTQKDSSGEDPEPSELYGVGVLCHVLQTVRIPDGTTKLLVEGNARARIESVDLNGDFMSAEICELETVLGDDEEGIIPLRMGVLDEFEKYCMLHPKIPTEAYGSVAAVDDHSAVADIVASHLTAKLADRQEVLEETRVKERLELLLHILIRENELMTTERIIHEKVRASLEKNNREHYLREQMKVIQGELDSSHGALSEVEEFKKRFSAAKMPADVLKKANAELERFSKMHGMSPEATVCRTYMDWLADMPWKKSTKEKLDINSAKEILDKDHYGLKDAKERILEYLAVRKLAGSDTRAQVLCFVGPPGVGKTSLAKSIAQAMNRKFASMSLGGVRDEAEIRGHRRTYIGALPGRVIQKIRSAQSNNPVLLMDEIDKLGNDFRGDPSSALLEVLDPEQNCRFADHFLEVPFDLSKVMFITTANTTQSIPRPLLDRMEVISLPGYVAEEKLHIARYHLWPRIMKETGLTNLKIDIPVGVIKDVITEYTREAGVRSLDRQLAKMARKIAIRIVTDEEKGVPAAESMNIRSRQVRTFLGPPKLHNTKIPREPSSGMAVGLAWTESGGDVLVIESVAMKGKGSVSFTGNLGDIMQESGQAALGYLRAQAQALGLGGVKWDELDVYVHVPEGATPKDGPSAGVTLALTMLSALSGRRVRNDAAMTGEITLHGNVLPVGGIKEKMLAAKRYGIYNVYLPEQNRADVEEMAVWAKKDINFNFVSSVKEVFGALLLPGEPEVKKRKKTSPGVEK